jgi:hypothetical protein
MQYDPNPCVQPLPDIPIPVGQVLRRLGYPSESAVLPDSVLTLLDEAMRLAAQLMKPKAVYRTLSIASNDSKTVTFHDTSFIIQSPQVARLLKNSVTAVCFAVTVGITLDKEISDQMARGEITLGYFIDAVGSETAEAAADELHWNVLQHRAQGAGGSVTARFSPGYGDWPLTVQKDLIEVCGGPLIGISVTPSFLMIPRKSISAVFGIRANK